MYQFSGVPATGTVTTTLGKQSQTVPLIGGNAEFVFHHVPAGTYTATSTYNGNSNWGSGSTTDGPIVVSPSPLLPSKTTLTLVSPANINSITPTTFVTVRVAVKGNGTLATTGPVSLLNSDTGPTSVPLTLEADGTSTGTYTFMPGSIAGAASIPVLMAIYPGDSNYSPSASTVLPLNNVYADFGLSVDQNLISVKSGATGSFGLSINSINEYSGIPEYTCTVTGGPAGNTVLPTCTFTSEKDVTPTQYGSATVVINAAVTTKADKHKQTFWETPATSTSVCHDSGSWSDDRSAAARQRTECAPAGNYAVGITATNGLTTHSASVTVEVQ
jgi:hypothetical protein